MAETPSLTDEDLGYGANRNVREGSFLRTRQYVVKFEGGGAIDPSPTLQSLCVSGFQDALKVGYIESPISVL